MSRDHPPEPLDFFIWTVELEIDIRLALIEHTRAVVESTRIWGRSLARATHGEKRKDEPAARGGI
ncbi:hypothetical protein DY000_02051187 [Brassica cretica]|uniref:Uncharacterized protein n=1 Tax=Brassica cretica TaxID=69181 RepID=A0ABQ7EP79_BRACR|nr:hypothetical protein DY000_02051187 [Brassica cretica]